MHIYIISLTYVFAFSYTNQLPLCLVVDGYTSFGKIIDLYNPAEPYKPVRVKEKIMVNKCFHLLVALLLTSK